MFHATNFWHGLVKEDFKHGRTIGGHEEKLNRGGNLTQNFGGKWERDRYGKLSNSGNSFSLYRGEL